jgi:hypothetical protein
MTRSVVGGNSGGEAPIAGSLEWVDIGGGEAAKVSQEAGIALPAAIAIHILASLVRRVPNAWPVDQAAASLGIPHTRTPLPSSRGLGHHPLKVDTRVRIPLGVPSSFDELSVASKPGRARVFVCGADH